jgi:hypothetical protein
VSVLFADYVPYNYLYLLSWLPPYSVRSAVDSLEMYVLKLYSPLTKKFVGDGGTSL